MTTKGKTYSERIRDARRGLDETMNEYAGRAGQIKYLRHLSAEGQAAEAASLRGQYKEHLAAEAASAWKLAQASITSAKADFQRAHAAHSERLDAGRLSWLAREYSAKLSAAPLTSDRVGAFDPVSWLGAQRDALAAANDVTAMRALRTVSREALPSAPDASSAARLARIMDADEAAEAADVVAAQRELEASERAAADLRRRILEHRLTLDPSAGAGLAGPDAFAREVFGDAPAPNVLVSS